ncbi:MAG TPA: MarR family transcriptional regulator [Clostridiales bacterium]|jgi:DNA-binding MarR family transcriptional regulator|nr:MarR family transcriptional regulator [Clostridiales bacterium]HRT81640.1 MarR family transcriptional regulator [Oscillospiraceae bacterium]
MDSTYGKLYVTLHRIRHLNIIGSLGLMPPPEMEVLGEIRAKNKKKPGETVTVSDISQSLHVSLPAVSRTLNRLEEKNYISREIDKNDRRNIRLLITEEGREALDENVKKLTAFLQKAFDDLGEEKTKALSEILDELYLALCREIGEVNKNEGPCGK